MKLIIEDDEGRKTVVPLVRDEITIGRDDGNVVKLTERNVSRRHARLKRKNGQLLIEDIGSYNGVLINGDRIAEPTPVKEGDLIEIGDYDLGVEGRFEAPPPHDTPAPRATIPPSAPQPDSTPGASVGGATAIIRVTDVMKNLPQGETRDLQKTEMPRLVGLKFTLSADKADEPRPASVAPAASIDSPQPARTRKRKLPLLVPAAGGALALALVLATLFMTKARRGEQLTEGELSAGESIKAGDRELKKHDFLKALDFYDAAVVKGETAPNRAKAQDEARAQELNRDLDRAIANGDFDKGRAIYEKCASETTWFCQRVQEKVDQMKAGYAKVHLARAQTAKAGGKADVCKQELQQVLAFDATNAEAQGTQCLVVQQAQGEKPAPARRPPTTSQAQRDQKAYQLIQEANAKVTSRDFESATAKYQAALDSRPSRQYIGHAYRGLGTAAVYAGDTKAAVKWYKLYMPYADDATRAQLQQLIDKFGG